MKEANPNLTLFSSEAISTEGRHKVPLNIVEVTKDQAEPLNRPVEITDARSKADTLLDDLKEVIVGVSRDTDGGAYAVVQDPGKEICLRLSRVVRDAK